MLVSQFLLGLKEELRQVVELHLPETVSQAVTLASILEHVTTQTRPYHKRIVG
jgi:ferritin-like metal-binding protein YciE